MKERKVALALISNKNLLSVYVYNRQGKTLKIQVFGSNTFMGFIIMFVIRSFLMSCFSESQEYNPDVIIFLLLNPETFFISLLI